MTLALNTKTQWGKVGAVGIIEGERYYWLVDKYGSVSMMPAIAVEPANPERGKGPRDAE